VSPESPYRLFPLPGSRRQYSPDKPGLVRHIALDLRLDISQRSLTGSCRIRVQLLGTVTSLTLDAVQMEIKAVRSGAEILRFDQDRKSVV